MKIMDQFIEENKQWSNQLSKDLRLNRKKLYLTVRHFLACQFNQALKENETEAEGWKKVIEKLEVRYLAGEDLNEYSQVIIRAMEDIPEDEFDIEKLKSSAKIHNEEFKNEQGTENVRDKEWCKNYEQKVGEIDVSDLPL